MNKAVILVASLAIALGACKPKTDGVQPASSTGSGQPATHEPAAGTDLAPKGRSKATSPDRIDSIVKTGRTGLWSSVTEVCPKERPPTVLAWNVRASGVSHVILFVQGRKGTERHFGRGGAVGERKTGPWLVPGMVFRIKDPAGEVLGEVKIGKKAGC